MADEIRIQSTLTIEKGNLNYSSRPTLFQADVSAAAPTGPSPGSLLAATAGTDVSLTQLTTPGVCRISNLDTDNFVEYGIWDSSTFHELGEILPGEFYVLRLSRNMTGLRLKANTAACECLVEAFEA